MCLQDREGLGSGRGPPRLLRPLGSGPLAEDFLTGSHCLVSPSRPPWTTHVITMNVRILPRGNRAHTTEQPVACRGRGAGACAEEVDTTLVRGSEATSCHSGAQKRPQEAWQPPPSPQGGTQKCLSASAGHCYLTGRPCSTWSSHTVSPGEHPKHGDPQVCHL